jgi:hypothetical protein
MYIHIFDTCTTVSTVLPIVSVWDPRMHYEFGYITFIILDIKYIPLMYIHISDTCTNVSTVLIIASVWNPGMLYKF